jgi:menaquinone-dependent protoporphyrinogen oxidase
VKILVTFASKHGATAEIAEAIGDVLARRDLDVSVMPTEDVRSLQEYDAFILGSAIYMGQWLRPANELVERSADVLVARRVWLFSSGPVGDPPRPEENAVDAAAILATTHAREHQVFGGKLVKKRLSFGEKAIAIALRAPEGDYRDWAEIRQWAAKIGDALTTELSGGDRDE